MKAKEVVAVWQKLAKNKGNKAVLLYVLAMLHVRIGMVHAAKGFALECLEVLAKSDTSTLEACATNKIQIEGVMIPGIFHEGVVVRNMMSVGVDLH